MAVTLLVFATLLISISAQSSNYMCYERCLCLQRLKLVDCSGLNLEIIPNFQISNLDKFSSISLRNNRITHFNASIFHTFTTIEFIDLRGNPLDCVQLYNQEIPAVMTVITDCVRGLSTLPTPSSVLISSSNILPSNVILPHTSASSRFLSSLHSSTPSPTPKPCLYSRTPRSSSILSSSKHSTSINLVQPSSSYSTPLQSTVTYPPKYSTPTPLPRPASSGFTSETLYIYVIVGVLIAIIIISIISRITYHVWKLHHPNPPIRPYLELSALNSEGERICDSVQLSENSSDEEIEIYTATSV